MERISLRVEAHVLQRASRSGYVAAGTAVADELTDDAHVKDSHSSSSADPAVEPPAEVASIPALVLKSWSSIKELQSRLRELGALICEQIAAQKKMEEENHRGEKKAKLTLFFFELILANSS